MAFYLSGCQTPEPKLPEISKGGVAEKRVTVSVTGDDKIYINDQEILMPRLDSALEREMDVVKKQPLDTVTVIISADSAASYGVVFGIMRLVKKKGGKAVANVKGISF